MESNLSIIDYMNLDRQNRHKNGHLIKKSIDRLKREKYWDKHYNFAAIEKLSGLEFKTLGKPSYVVAGGIFSSHGKETDIDIFIYRDHEATLKEIIKTISELDRSCQIYRTGYTVDIYFGHNGVKKYQIILRKYASIAEILYGFDLGPSQVAFNGKHFYFTIMSHLALKTGLMIADTTRRSTTFEKRIVKYVKKGFTLILPFFKPLSGVDKTPNGYKALDNDLYNKTPSPYFIYEKENFYSLVTIENPYSPFGLDVPAGRTDKINLRFLAQRSHCFCIYGMEISNNEFARLKQLSKDKYHLIHAGVLDNKYEDVPSSLIPGYKGIVNTIKAQKKEVFDLKWMEINPGTQTPLIIWPNSQRVLSTSVNPILEDPSEWYGQYFNPLLGPHCPELSFTIWRSLKAYLINDIIGIIFECYNRGHLALKPTNYWDIPELEPAY